MDQLGLAFWESASIEWGNTIRIMSWNVNGIRAIAKKGFFDAIKKTAPTILCLQEIKAFKEQCEIEIQEVPAYGCFWQPAKRPGYSGVAIYSKQKPLEVVNGMGIEKFDYEGRLIMAKYEHFTVVSMYLPNGGSGPERHAYKMEFLEKSFEHFKLLESQGHKLVICGDYNIAHAEKDVFDPIALANQSGFLPEERAWMSRLLESGFVDTFRHFHPNELEAYTWWSYLKGDRFANRGWRIDSVLISKSLVPHLTKATIHTDILGSDHCPVSADFEFS